MEFRNLRFQEKKLTDGIQRFSSQDKILIISALELAKVAHAQQKRDEGDPYVIHPIRLANTLIYDLGVRDTDLVIAGILHDVVEDSDISLKVIEERFGKKVAELVAALTREKDRETKRQKFERTKRGPPEVRLLKTCDWLDNLRSFPFRTDRGERWQRHLKEAREMYIPLAEATADTWLLAEMQKADAVVNG